MTKNKVLKKIETLEDKIALAIHNLQDYLDSTEDPIIGNMGADLCEATLEFIHENEACNLEDIRNHVEEAFDEA
jgi:hypothetical protein